MNAYDEAAALYPIQTSVGKDYKAWAKRIVHREQRKDRDLLPVQVNFAYQALDMPLPGSENK